MKTIILCLIIFQCSFSLNAQIYSVTDNESLYLLGEEKYNLRLYDSAIVIFNQVLDRDSLYTDAYYYRAMSFMKSGKYAQSEHDFDCVVALNPLYLPSFEDLVYKDRSELFKIQKQYDKAAQEFYKWAKIAPKDFKPYSKLASFYDDIGWMDSCIKAYLWQSHFHLTHRNFMVSEVGNI